MIFRTNGPSPPMFPATAWCGRVGHSIACCQYLSGSGVRWSPPRQGTNWRSGQRLPTIYSVQQVRRAVWLQRATPRAPSAEFAGGECGVPMGGGVQRARSSEDAHEGPGGS